MLMLSIAALVAIAALCGVFFLARVVPSGRYSRYVGESTLWCGVGAVIIMATAGRFVACDHGS